jgi:hypothetical protein
MKKILSIAILFGALQLASAVTIYTEDWGGANTSVRAANTLGLVGWTVIANRQGTPGPWYGIYGLAAANDPGNGLGLTPNVVYFTALTGTNQLGGPGMFYTMTGAGSGSAGNSAFADINPASYTNLTFNVEVRNAAGNLTNYFAVRVGTSWYVAINNQLPLYTDTGGGTYATFTNWTMVYTANASVWNNLTLNATYVTIGSVAGANLSGNITGIGIVELENTNFTSNGDGFNYNKIVINQGQGDFPSNPPTNSAAAVTPQYVYVGGGASFLPTFTGAPNLIYRWKTNGVIINSGVGSKYVGAQTTMLTITNANTNDAFPTYSVVVTNFFGRATNDGMNLIVSNVPAGYLYAETFPYVGPSGNLPFSGVGWVSAVSAGAVGIWQNAPGIGIAYSWSGTATTNAYFTTVTNDTGLSGLPFVAINPASYPAVTLQAQFAPGNGAGTTAANITIYWAVQMGGTWYSSVSPIPTSLTQGNYGMNQLAFNPAATNWNNLTITLTNNSVAIGSQASSALTGNITGAGLIVVHNNTSGASMNFENFAIITNAVTIQAPAIGNNFPLDVGVYSGGGASFGVSATGTQPFTYSWTTNGVLVQDGGRVSGATTPTLTIANLNSGDNGMQIVAYVTNSVGGDESDNSYYGYATLTVSNVPAGLLYSEAFPFVGPVVQNYSISSVGWVEAVVSGAPNALFETTPVTSEGAVSAFFGSAGTTVYYATTATDTNQAGLPFPNINLASYTNLNFSVQIAPYTNSANVTAFLAVQLVQLNGTNWYVAANPLPVITTSDSSTYQNITTNFNPAAANWDNLTVTGSGGSVGSPAASNLSGVMTGAGLVFVTVGIGGDFNFDNFQITGINTSLGSITVGPLTGGNITLSWVPNALVNLQSTTNLLGNWQDVANTLGVSSLTVSVTGPQKFFRLIKH